MKLKDASPDEQPEVHTFRAVTISNDLYGKEFMSAFEMAKGFTKPILNGFISTIPDDIVNAH